MSLQVQSRTDIPSRRRRRLLQGVSTIACATALGAGVSWAGDISALRNAAHVSVNPTGAPSIAAPVMPGLSTDGSSASGAMARSLRNAATAQQTVSLAQQAQSAAQQAAAALPSSVPDGLAPGGLMPVVNAVLAASDPTGLNTWQGANAPTQTTGANGQILVDVQQTSQRAVLDWQTFNVGSNTTLNFDQSQNGAAQPDWVVLNRVVGQLDPTTGLRNPNLAPAPSQILGQIKAQGTVLVINQNGILFGAGAQVNTNALIASSLEIGNQLISVTSFNGVSVNAPSGVAATLAQRDNLFLNSGLLSGGTYALSSQATTTVLPAAAGNLHNVTNTADTSLEGAVTVAAGAQITSGQGGYIILAAPNVSNAGALTSDQGQVSLVSGRGITLLPSSGGATAGDNPNIRGLGVASINDFSGVGQGVPGTVQDSVVNTATGVIQASEGYISLTTTSAGQATNAGVLAATTSVARNGFIQIGSNNITLAPSSVISITPDDTATIPQDPNSLADFKPSLVEIGSASSVDGTLQPGGVINIGANSLIYAPSANIYIGSVPGLDSVAPPAAPSQVFIDSGAVIDASGLKGVLVSGSVHEVTISPVTANDTADTPSQRTLLDHATVTIDPRLSGVRADGVAWVGSPLIPAEAYAEQVGVTASQLMTKGGNVLIGAATVPGTATSQAPDVIIKPGAVIDISGGWITYQAGWVQTTQLVAADGTIVNIGDASPDDTYLGVYNGYTWVQPRYGISQSFANPLLTGAHYEPAYSQGADAGSLTIKSSQPSLEGTIYAGAYTGPLQAQTPQIGTATPTVFGDQRHLQATGSQLPVGGFLSILETSSNSQLAGGDVEIVDGPEPATTANLVSGQSIPVNERETLILSAPALNGMGLGQLSVFTSGALTVDAGADVTLAPGGVFSAVTGRAITVNGAITVPSGTISLQTVTSSGSIFNPTPQALGDYDVAINGQLSAAGLWTNDFTTAGPQRGDAYINGGSITIQAAARADSLGSGDVVKTADTTAGTAPKTATDVSGSILIDGPNSLIDVSAGGYVTPDGTLELTATGGNLSLIDDAFYFPFSLSTPANSPFQAGDISGFRVNGLLPTGSTSAQLPVNPSAINAQVAIGDGAVRGYGFAGGGTFSLETPSVALADGIAQSGANLPLDFFSKAGFSTYDITSYATQLTANTFTNGLGGYNAVLQTQVLTVQSGQTLNLTQTGYTRHLSATQTAALEGLASGGQLGGLLAPTIDADAFDQRPVSLNFGGLIEFEVAQGGQVIGAAGAQLTAPQINNLGVISLPGGTLGQSMTLPQGYAGRDPNLPLGISTVLAVPSLSSVFSVDANGGIDESAPSRIDPTKTNAQIAAQDYIYLTGDLPANVGIELAPGSVTDLSGAVLLNPYAPGITQSGRQVATGTLVGGGTLQTAVSNAAPSTTPLFSAPSFEGNPVFKALDPFSLQPGLSLVAEPGSTINLAGASGVFDELGAGNRYVSTPQWSDGGSLTLGAGGTLTGAAIDAHGGAPQANGGVLTTSSLTLTAVDPATPTANTLSAAQIEQAGFGVLSVQGDLATQGGPVNLTLGQAFYLAGAPVSTVLQPGFTGSGDGAANQSLYPTVSVAGSLQINAPYIALDGAFQVRQSTTYAADSATTATGQVTFNAQALDVVGSVLFDQSVASVTLNSTGDLRLIGVAPHQSNQSLSPSLMGQLITNGDLTLSAAQVYATTGSSFDVTSTAPTGLITIASAAASPPPTPYSAGSNLTVQAADIVQNGVLRAPVGALTLGANSPLAIDGVIFAPATLSVTLGAGSITSVSADGLSIPYGTTTDQKEYYFSPTNANPLTAPPAAILTLGGKTVTTAPGATVDLSGGGDVFAYEFVPGTGGSRDVLSQFNADAFTSNDGYQFPDHRQVYAIVPGLSSAPVAAYDPIYSSNYGPLYAQGGAGQRVYLNAAPGVAAGWYTLLPAQYAVLPGAMEVVEDTTAVTVPVGPSSVLSDGTVVTSGQFGGLGGAMQSTPHLFDIKSHAVIDSYSDIVLTSANANFSALAASNGAIAPRLPQDAGRLVLNPTATLNLSGDFLTAPAPGGRGDQVDITGAAISVVAQVGAPVAGVVQVGADQLSNLNADSLLIGGTRTDNADGTTSLSITAHQVTVANDAAHPLTGPEVLLAADGAGGGIVLDDGAVITASGTETSGLTGDYLIAGAAGGQTARGAVLRVSTGAPRLVTRSNEGATASGGLTVGAATLSGPSILLDSTDTFSLSPSASLSAQNLALSANAITFAPSPAGISGLTITPALTASLGATALTLRSPNVINLAAAGYSFGALTIDAPGLAVSGGVGQVSINAGAVLLHDSSADAGACAVSGPLACGAGVLALNSQSLTFGDGTFRIYGAGQGVNVSAPGGVFFQGQGAFDVGAAPLAIATPYLGDQAAVAQSGVAPEIPSLAITTTGAIALTNPGGAVVPAVAGAPGAGLTLSGAGLSIAGVDVRATAGTMTLTSSSGISVGSGSVIETPGYSRTFGDAADPYTVSAPGGLLTLTAQNGGITLAPGSVLSVGGGTGNAGSLTLNASQGQVSFGGTLNAAAPGGGASFTLNETGAFDLTGFEAATAGAFNGDVSVETGTGDLMLAAGTVIKAANVGLTADGGRVDIAGTIDVSGINGGQVGLFGAGGVTLESSALIAARASGYGADDTRQASGGLVELGTAGSSALTVAAGAVIDVSAARTTPRIVEGEQNGLITYNYVAADQGGTVVLRAPASGPDHAETVDVSFGGTIQGASSVVLEGYRAYDLGAIASSGQFVGVDTTTTPGTAILDTTTAASGGHPNFLADEAAGTIPTFIQDFNVSASYGALGGLASQANFQARPGVELDYSGNITLASNWNLGAGVVNVAGAVAAGLMVAAPTVPGAFSVVPGDEGAVLAGYTQMTYRVNGSPLGAPGTLSLRAGGQLNINGSITDGFFAFGDQTDPAYLNYALGAGNRTADADFLATCNGTCASAPAYVHGGATPANRVLQGFSGSANISFVSEGGANLIPYDAAANTPGALGSGAGGAGDPIGSAEIFPLVQGPNGLQPVQSWSYQFTGGAKAGSANPLEVQANATGGVTVQGTKSYTYGGVAGSTTVSNTALFNVNGSSVTAANWLQAEETAYGLNANSAAQLTLSNAPAAVVSQLETDAGTFFSALNNTSLYTLAGTATKPTAVITTLALVGAFIESEFSTTGRWPTFKTSYTGPSVTAAPTTTVTTQTLIRSGTGSIALAAAGTIDLRNGAAPTYLNATTGAITTAASGFQRGGVAIYTAGTPVIPGLVTATDDVTGATVTLDPSAFETTGENVGVLNYGYGVATGTGVTQGFQGLLVSNTIYANGGGDISLTAGGDVLGRRDAYDEERLATGGAVNFIGFFNQPWRTGTVGAANAGASTNLLVDPQMFREGLGALGGGDITVRAGGVVSDITVADDTSVTTGTARGGVAAGQTSQGLITFGGGNVSIAAGGDLLGSRVDVGSGVGQISAGGSILSAGSVTTASMSGGGINQNVAVDDTLRLRLTDATIDLTAHGDVVLQGVEALGVQENPSNTSTAISNGYAANFYSPMAGVSVVADGSVSLQNIGDVLPAAGNTPSDLSNQHLAVLPGAFTAEALEGDLTLNINPAVTAVLLAPSSTGTLTLAAGMDIEAATVAMLDNEPGSGDAFPAVLPSTTLAQLQAQHDPRIPHQNDPVPNRVYAGEDILDLTLSSPKQTRIGAGRDIINMAFFGQNLNPGDITRIEAGRDITATTQLEQGSIDANGRETLSNQQEPVVQGNTFVLGGPGDLIIDAGRNLGPFLTSATDTTTSMGTQSYGGGILTVGNAWNPYLPQQGADIEVAFGVAKGEDFAALANYYLNPANTANLPDYLFNGAANANNVFTPDKSQPIYAPQLIAYMQAHQAAALTAAYGTTAVTYDQAYQAFMALPQLAQQPFLLQIYFNELSLTSVPGQTFDQYQRGYQAANLLFPASLGYTQNALGGGTNGANTQVQTGDLDLRLATIQTQYGGNIDILGPGGRVLAGSTVATAQQAARRYSNAELVYAGNPPVNSSVIAGFGPARGDPTAAGIDSIPAGYEGVLTLRGGDISTFTDGDFVLNQSRLFTEEGGNIVMWSSNGDLNAGQGPKTSSDFPPVQVRIDSDAFSQLDQTSAVTGAGIAAFQPAPGTPEPNVYLIAPRGTVDAGAAGVRVAGNLFVAALHVANADNFQVAGTAIGLPPVSTTVQVGATTTAASASAVQAAQTAVANAAANVQPRSIITAEVLGFGDEGL